MNCIHMSKRPEHEASQKMMKERSKEGRCGTMTRQPDFRGSRERPLTSCQGRQHDSFGLADAAEAASASGGLQQHLGQQDADTRARLCTRGPARDEEKRQQLPGAPSEGSVDGQALRLERGSI